MNWFKKKEKDLDREKLFRLEMNALQGVVRTTEKQTHEILTLLKELKYQMNADMKNELDTVQRKYVVMLEGKLIQFDQEASRIKAEKDAEYQRLHGYFYSGGRP